MINQISTLNKMETKTCNTCNNSKHLTNFSKAKTCPDGYRGRCKDCDKPRKQRHYQNNKEKYKLAYQAFMSRNPDYHKNRKDLKCIP